MYKDIIEFMEKKKDIDYITLKKNLRAKRRELGLTPKFFEQTVGIPAQQYCQLEKLSYKYKPSTESLIKICHAMDVSILELLGEEKPAITDSHDSVNKTP